MTLPKLNKGCIIKGMAGRNEIEVTAEMLADVERMGAQRLNKRQIAHCLGVSESWFFRHLAEPGSQLKEAVKRGQSKGIESATKALLHLVEKNNLGAICYYLNNVASKRWSNTQHVEQTIDDKRPPRKRTEDEINAELDQLRNKKAANG